MADTISLADRSILHGNPAMLCEQAFSVVRAAADTAALSDPVKLRVASNQTVIRPSFECTTLMAPQDSHFKISLSFHPKRRILLRASRPCRLEPPVSSRVFPA